MKKLIIVILMALCLSFAVYAGDDAVYSRYSDQKDKEIETLVGSKGRSGFNGSLVMKFTELIGEEGVMVGAKLGWTINGAFTIGVAGYGWANDCDQWNRWDEGFQMGYGGLYLESIIGNHKLVHLTVGVLLGAGGVEGYPGIDHRESRWSNCGSWDVEGFFICEPEVNIELNVARFMRIGAGVSYRFTSGLKGSNINNSDLNGLAGALTIKFGKF
ncbi:MAG: hypothetical protein GY765_04950 [bacterium]|nr:hypothetical protein [bacterium]